MTTGGGGVGAGVGVDVGCGVSPSIVGEKVGGAVGVSVGEGVGARVGAAVGTAWTSIGVVIVIPLGCGTTTSLPRAALAASIDELMAAALWV